MKKINIDKELFIQNYPNMSIQELANLFNVSVGTIHNYAKKWGLYKGAGAKAKNILVIVDL